MAQGVIVQWVFDIGSLGFDSIPIYQMGRFTNIITNIVFLKCCNHKIILEIHHFICFK